MTARKPGTSHPAARKPGKVPPATTREHIAADIAAFRAAGGQIEVLGVTRTLLRIDAVAEPAPPRAHTRHPTQGDMMPKPNYSYEKRQRELAKKKKKEAKAAAKLQASTPAPADEKPVEPPAQ